MQLVQGEALFEVTHQVNIPEVTSLTPVRVLGTVFNVRQWQEGNQVTVLKGRVRVTPDHEADQGKSPVASSCARGMDCLSMASATWTPPRR